MIPATKTVKTEGDLGGTKIAMGIRAEDMAHIMGVVTDLYSDKALAILREYSTNAHDAHKDSGVTRPIEVTLPTRFNEYLVIRDFGTGMSVSDLTDTYGNYGRSTKRDSNEFNGCLGLGSKSALTYGNTFTVTSVKDGIKSEVVVYRDEAGLGQLNVVDTSSTKAPNGTTVTIPTKKDDNFKAKAAEFYKMWDKGTVLVDGIPPVHLSADQSLTSVGDFYIRPSERHYGESTLHVIMGGVTYTQKMDNMKQFRVPLEVYAFVGIGEVEFVPSREALQLSKATQATIDRLWAEAGDQYLDSFTTEFKAAKTLREAIKLFLPMQRVLGVAHGLTFGDLPIEDRIEYSGRSWERGYGGSISTAAADKVYLASMYRDDHARIVNRKSKSSMNAGEKFRLAEYLRIKDLEAYQSILFMGEDHPLLAGMNEVDWLDVLEVTKTAGVAKVVKPKDEWEYFHQSIEDDRVRRLRAFGQVPDTAKVILYVSTTELANNYYNSIDLDLLKHLDADTIIVMVNKNRQEKFVRDNDGAIHLSTYIDQWIDKTKVSITDLEKQALAAADSYNERDYTRLAGLTDDPHIDLIHGTIEGAKEKVRAVDQVMRMSRRGSFSVQAEDYLDTKYPLMNTDHMDHTILYINTIFKMGK